MITTSIDRKTGVASLELAHGRVNALRLDVVQAFDEALDAVESDARVRSIVLTGAGAFFSFGFDVPHFLEQSDEHFEGFLHAFTALYTRVFGFPKPVVAAINGHAVAGGWMIAQACDVRVLARGNVKVGLNEVRFGAALFAGSMAILRHLVGGRIADRVAGSGPFLMPGEALQLGLVDTLCKRDDLPMHAAMVSADRYGGIEQPAFSVIRQTLRGPIIEAYLRDESASIDRFLSVWRTPAVQRALRDIAIR